MRFVPSQKLIEDCDDRVRLGRGISAIRHQGVEFVFRHLLVRAEPMAYTMNLYAPFLASLPVLDFSCGRDIAILSLVSVSGIAEA